MNHAELKKAIDDRAERILMEVARVMQPHLDELQAGGPPYVGPLLAASLMAYGRCLALDLPQDQQAATEALTLEYIKRMRGS